ncbi:hypothetical protein RHMOL_Rhmol08G0210700 [Rhododendron molle]|uniref:Uncharacterized protein n=1 Tax=Rhododendron molle TaxID=49168 RepID=A0ACC0MQZ7_RHOML|nr:hypothetical protein RHMOL_Rhmol08G0210700 [Rhododendron molle]
MKEKDVDLPFSSYLQFHKPSKKTDKTELKVITKSKWEKSNKTVVSHPPLESSIIDYKGSSITASPLKLPTDKSDCKQIVEQVNYTNQCLKTISKRLETKLEDGIASCVLSPSKELEKPLINLPDCRSPIFSSDDSGDDVVITSDYHSPSSTDNPVKIGCTDTCCKEINVLTQELPEEDLLIDDVASKQHYTKKLEQMTHRSITLGTTTLPVLPEGSGL